MKNFFFAADAARKARLQEANISFCDLDLDGVAGIVVEEEQIGRALEVLGARKESEFPSSLEGIFSLALRFEAGGGINVSRTAVTAQPKQYRVEIDGRSQYRCNHWERFALLIQAWVKERKLPIDVMLYFVVDAGIASGTPFQRPSGDGRLHIFLGKGKWEVENAMEDKEGKQYAQCIMGQKYIRIYGLPDCPDDAEFKNTKALLQRLLQLSIESDLKKIANIMKQRVDEIRKKSREQYVAECSRRFEKTVQGTKEAVKKGREDIARLQQELARRIRETQGAEQKLSQIESLRSDQTASYGREFDSLAAVPGVEKVEVADGVIKVFTEHIYITPDGCADTFEIGKFRMEIYTSGSNGGIRFFNLTRQGTGGDYNTNHPHVKRDGRPCLGNISEMVPTLIGEYEYSAVAQIGLQYLKSVNTSDSAGSGIFSCWPKVEKK